MTEQILAPIELNDDELLAVSGGRIAVGIAQSIHQAAAVEQFGGDLSIGGSGATAVTGNLTFTESFSAPGIGQGAENFNTGSVNGTVAVKS